MKFNIKDVVQNEFGEVSFLLNGDEVKVRKNPMYGNLIVEFGAIHCLHLPDPSTAEQIAYAVIGFGRGMDAGQHIGKEILKNDFKRLFSLFQ